MTFDLDILGFLPLSDRCFVATGFDPEAAFLVSPDKGSSIWPALSDCIGLFLTGVGIPDGISRGLLKIPPGRGDHGPLPIPGLFVIKFNVSTFGCLASTTGFNPEVEGRVVLANELAVGAKSLEDESLEESLEDDDPAAGALFGAPESFLAPMLPTPREVGLAADEKEERVPIDETLVEPPVLEDAPVPLIELTLLTLVPLMKLPLVEGAVPKEGIGDLAREEVVETVALSASLLTRRDGTRLRLPLAVAVEGRAMLTEGTRFVAGNGAGAVIFSVFATGLGIPVWATLAGAGAVVTFPRFHTFCTSDFAEERNPNLEGLGFSEGSSQFQK